MATVLTAQGITPVPPAKGSVIGDNQPTNAYDALKAHIDDLYHEAANFLDGKPIENDAQADAVSRILDDARKARAAAEAQRKIEAEPFDKGKAEVQAKWTPLTDDKKGRCALIAETCKKALAPFLQKKEDARLAAVEAARQEAERQAAAASKARAAAATDDLAGQETARILQENAVAAQKAADRLDKSKTQVRGGERANSLRERWVATLVDPVAALKHYRVSQPGALKEWLLEQAEKDVRAGARTIPGFEITDTKGVV